MKKLICTVVAAAVIAAGMLITAGGCGGGKPRLYVYNWVDYIPDDVIRDFEKRYNVRVIYDMFETNEEMYAKLKAGGGGYDVVFPSGDYVSIMITEGMLKAIDKSLVPNIKHLDPAILAKILFDPETKYCVPFAVGASGITVNTEKVQNYPRTWRIFEMPELKGRMTLLDDMREVMGAALRTLDYSVNSTDTAQLEEARDLVLEWKKNIVRFDASAFGKGFAAGEFWAVHGYAENVHLQLDDDAKATADFFIPEVGGSMYMDNMVILNSARNVDLAYKFINFIHEPEIYARIMDYLLTPSINVAARKHMTETPMYQIEDLGTSEFKEDLGEYLDLYNRIWQEIRVGR